MLHCIDERRASTNARAVGLEQVFAPQVDAGDEHPAYDAHDHAVGHHPACDAKAHTAGVCHPGCGQAGVAVDDPACQAKGAATLLPGVETLLPVQNTVVHHPVREKKHAGQNPAEGAATLLPGVETLLPVQIGVVVGDPACQAKGAAILLPGVAILLPVQIFPDDQTDDHAAVISPACDAKQR